MKAFPIAIAAFFIGASFPLAARAAEPVELEITQIEDFFEPLSALGAWVNVRPFGWCWYPTGVADDWRPYANGRWIQTDEGPYWHSEEPWAWATYHYGRWFQDVERGWIWKPDIEWAPAWVDWREGEEVVGWAPLPPPARVVENVVVYTPEPYIAPASYVFVEYRSFWRPIYPSFVFFWDTWHPHHHRRYYDCTKRVTKIKHVTNITVNNPAPQPPRVKQHSTRGIQSVTAHTPASEPAVLRPSQTSRTRQPISREERQRVWSRALEAQAQPRRPTTTQPATARRQQPIAELSKPRPNQPTTTATPTPTVTTVTEPRSRQRIETPGQTSSRPQAQTRAQTRAQVQSQPQRQAQAQRGPRSAPAATAPSFGRGEQSRGGRDQGQSRGEVRQSQSSARGRSELGAHGRERGVDSGRVSESFRGR